MTVARETCCCGAEIRVSTTKYIWIEYRLKDFRDAHTDCRLLHNASVALVSGTDFRRDSPRRNRWSR